MTSDALPRFTREAAFGEILTDLREIRADPPEHCDAVDLANLEALETVLQLLADGARKVSS